MLFLLIQLLKEVKSEPLQKLFLDLSPLVFLGTMMLLKEKLEDKNFKTNLNLIQTYKSLSIAEGMRLEPNNPVFILKGKK